MKREPHHTHEIFLKGEMLALGPFFLKVRVKELKVPLEGNSGNIGAELLESGKVTQVSPDDFMRYAQEHYEIDRSAGVPLIKTPLRLV